MMLHNNHIRLSPTYSFIVLTTKLFSFFSFYLTSISASEIKSLLAPPAWYHIRATPAFFCFLFYSFCWTSFNVAPTPTTAEKQLLPVQLKPILLRRLLLLTPTQTNPAHLSPEQSGRPVWLEWGQCERTSWGQRKGGLKELLTHLNSHPLLLAHADPELWPVKLLHC